MTCYTCAVWLEKLKSWGMPSELAYKMSENLGNLPYDPNQFTSVQQLVPVMEQHGFQSLDWWEDFQQWLQQLMETLIQITPGIILTVVGGAVLYFLRNVKYKKFPVGIVGLIPLGYGLWLIIQPFLAPTQPSA